MNRGASGNKTIFQIGTATYVTTAVPPGQRIGLKEALALVSSGAAVPQVPQFIDQFPWTKPPK